MPIFTIFPAEIFSFFLRLDPIAPVLQHIDLEKVLKYYILYLYVFQLSILLIFKSLDVSLGETQIWIYLIKFIILSPILKCFFHSGVTRRAPPHLPKHGKMIIYTTVQL